MATPSYWGWIYEAIRPLLVKHCVMYGPYFNPPPRFIDLFLMIVNYHNHRIDRAAISFYHSSISLRLMKLLLGMYAKDTVLKYG